MYGVSRFDVSTEVKASAASSGLESVLPVPVSMSAQALSIGVSEIVVPEVTPCEMTQ